MENNQLNNPEMSFNQRHDKDSQNNWKTQISGDVISNMETRVEQVFNNSDLKPNGEVNFFDEGGNIDPLLFVEFVKNQGYRRIFEEGRDEVRIIKNHNKVVRFFNYKTETSSLLLNNTPDTICKHDMVEQIVKKKATILKCWEFLESEPLLLHRDTRRCIYIPFKNGVAEVTSEGVKLLDYDNPEIGFFMEVESMNHDFKEFDLSENRKAGDFEKFLIYAITGRKVDVSELDDDEREKVLSFYSMIGYLISNYKNPIESPAIILSDEGADDETRDGGRGKSLLIKALSKTRMMLFKGGEEFDPSYRHNYAGLEKYHDLLIADDVSAGFNYDALYTQISEDITPERKGTTSETIKFKDTPKIVISTNWAVRYDKKATSTNRRFAEYKFTNFWSINNTPINTFGRAFFDDWDVDEWNRFYQFLTACCANFLRDGLKRISYDKAQDNFKAYFGNSALREEFKRILDILTERKTFTVNDFLREYNNSILFSSKMFTHINTRKLIEVYTETNQIPFEYSQRDRTWNKVEAGDDEDVEESEKLPF